MRKNSLLLLSMVLTVFLVGSVWGQMVLQVDDATYFLGTSNTLTISLENDAAVAALQFDMTFDPDCFTIDPTSLAKTARSEALNIFQASSPEPGLIKLAATGIGTAIDAGSGPIAEFTVDVAGDCAEGVYEFALANTKLADASGSEYPHDAVAGNITVMAAACIPEFNATSFDLGDVLVGSTGEATLTVTNVGTAAGEVTITADGCASADPASFSLGMGATQEVIVGCSPTVEGPCTGTLTFDGCGTDVIDVACVGVCPYIETNCPIDFGDVTIVETQDMTLTITNTADATADLNVSAITVDDADFSVGALPGPIAPGASAGVTITVAPSAVEGAVTATATIESDACNGTVECELTVSKLTPPFVILGFDKDLYITKWQQPDTVQVTIDQVTDVLPVYSVYMRVVVDTNLAFIDTLNVPPFFMPGKTVIDSAGWDIKVHAYPTDWDYAPLEPIDSTANGNILMGVDLWLIGGIPLTTNGCLVNLHLVPNFKWIAAANCSCNAPGTWGYPYPADACQTTLKFLAAMVNEGEPEVVYDAEAYLKINTGPVWDTFEKILPTHTALCLSGVSGMANGTGNHSDILMCVREGDGFCDYGQYTAYYHINASDNEGDMQMLYDWIPSALSNANRALIARYSDTLTLPAALWWWYYVYPWTWSYEDYAPPPFPGNLTVGVNDTTGAGWWYMVDIPKVPDYVGDHTDTYVVQTTHTTPTGWGGPQPCYDTLNVTLRVEETHLYADWTDMVFHACGGPEPVVYLCVNEKYGPWFSDLYGYLGAGSLIYSIDMIVDYECGEDQCLVPYEVGNERFWTENHGALTYSIDEENCKIAVSLAFNDAFPGDPYEVPCDSLFYVGFQLLPESVNPACTTEHVTELSIDHVKINEQWPHVCWDNGAIIYVDYSLAGMVYYSDHTPWSLPLLDLQPVNNVTIDFTDIATSDILATVLTGESGHIPPWPDGYYGYGPFGYCPAGYCIVPSKEGVPDGVITAQDASMILRTLCNQVQLSHNDSIAADVTCNGAGLILNETGPFAGLAYPAHHSEYIITAYDAAVLLRYLVGYPVESCIGDWVFEYIPGDNPYYQFMPYVCYVNLSSSHLTENFETVIIGDVTQNYITADGKVVVTTPEVTFSGREAKIAMSGEIYSATLELQGVMARNVVAPEGMLCEWRSADNVTKIAIASADPILDAAVMVDLESGENLSLYGSVNGVLFATYAEKVPVIPTEYSLTQNYPNPFNPVTSIDFGLPENSEVTITVYNVLGQVVTELVNGELDAGYHKVTWDASNMASGVYFYRIAAGDFTATKRMVLMK